MICSRHLCSTGSASIYAALWPAAAGRQDAGTFHRRGYLLVTTLLVYFNPRSLPAFLLFLASAYR